MSLLETLNRKVNAMRNALLGTDIKICHCCQKTSGEKLPTCSRCKLVGYCNRECQRKDWPKHRFECEHFEDIKKDVRMTEKEIKNLTGKSKKETRAEVQSNYDLLQSLDFLYESLMRVGHMVCLGRTLVDTGIKVPTQCVFEVNTSAREVFSKSKFESLRSTFVVTAYPFEHLEQDLYDPVFADYIRTKYTEQHPLDKDSGGCIWLTRPDHWRGERSTNTTNNMIHYNSAKLSTIPGIEKGVAEMISIRDMLMSQSLSLNGASQIPFSLMQLANDRNWNALANSSDFHNIVKDVPFGIMTRRTNNDVPDSKTAIVTLFVNAKVMNRFVEGYSDKLGNEFKEWSEKNGENYPEFLEAKLIENDKEFDIKFASAQDA